MTTTQRKVETTSPLIPAGSGKIFDWGMEMIKGGFETTVNLEGKEYKFNEKNG